MKVGVEVEADVDRTIQVSIYIVVGPSGIVWAQTGSSPPEPQDCP